MPVTSDNHLAGNDDGAVDTYKSLTDFKFPGANLLGDVPELSGYLRGLLGL